MWLPLSDTTCLPGRGSGSTPTSVQNAVPAGEILVCRAESPPTTNVTYLAHPSFTDGGSVLLYE